MTDQVLKKVYDRDNPACPYCGEEFKTVEDEGVHRAECEAADYSPDPIPCNPDINKKGDTVVDEYKRNNFSGGTA